MISGATVEGDRGTRSVNSINLSAISYYHDRIQNFAAALRGKYQILESLGNHCCRGDGPFRNHSPRNIKGFFYRPGRRPMGSAAGGLAWNGRKRACFSDSSSAQKAEQRRGDCRHGNGDNPLDFLAEVTQHVPNKGEHTIRYYGPYSNKKRGMQEKKKAKAEHSAGINQLDTPYRRTSRLKWAALTWYIFF